jgi:hypothetical protein
MVTETGVRVRRRRRWRHTWQLLHNEMLSSLFTPPTASPGSISSSNFFNILQSKK